MSFSDNNRSLQRRLCFKVVDLENKSSIYVNGKNFLSSYFDTDKYTVLFSTGVVDSNGILLFEGDYIEGIKKGPNKQVQEGIIKWNEKRASFEIKHVSSKKFSKAVLTSLHSIKKIGSYINEV